MTRDGIRSLAAEVMGDLGRWHHNCHAASLHLARSGAFPGSRVARGTCTEVRGQHSWLVLPKSIVHRSVVDGPLTEAYAQAPSVLGGATADAYDPGWIVDPTLWSYIEEIEGVWVGNRSRVYAPDRLGMIVHRPHGDGPGIMVAGRPVHRGGPDLPLTDEARAQLSDNALWWVDEMFGPLDHGGWMSLAGLPVSAGDWPAKEVYQAMVASGMEQLIPVDKLAMVTDGGWS